MPISEEDFVVSDDEGNYGYSTKNQRMRDKAKQAQLKGSRPDATNKRKPKVQVVEVESYEPVWIDTKRVKQAPSQPVHQVSFPPLPSTYAPIRSSNNFYNYGTTPTAAPTPTYHQNPNPFFSNTIPPLSTMNTFTSPHHSHSPYSTLPQMSVAPSPPPRPSYSMAPIGDLIPLHDDYSRTLPKPPISSNYTAYSGSITGNYSSPMASNFNHNYAPKPVSNNYTPITTPTTTTTPITSNYRASVNTNYSTNVTNNYTINNYATANNTSYVPKPVINNNFTMTKPVTSNGSTPISFTHETIKSNNNNNIATSSSISYNSYNSIQSSNNSFTNNSFVDDNEIVEASDPDDDPDLPPVDTRPIIEAEESTVQSMDTETLKKELLDEGTGTRWGEKTLSFMKKEILTRLVAKGGRYDRQERYLLKLAKQEFEDIPKDLQQAEDNNNNSSTTTTNNNNTSKSKKYDSLEDLMLQCKEFSEKILGILSNKETVEKQPTILTKNMKNYQVEGLQWLYTLHKADVNGILADEMGLGKTIQCISLFALLHEKGETQLPHLIIAPASTISNWAREIETWCPTLKYITYYGTQAERRELQHRILKLKEPHNIIITTYNIIKQKYDVGFFKKLQVNYVVLDEAQQIKDAQGQTYTKAAVINSLRRLLLTGSPLQNNLRELWALLSFVMPHLFTPNTSQWFKSSQPKASSPILDKLKPILNPFILRRLKSEVALELPDKLEVLEECPMTQVQKKLYKQVLTSSKKAWKQYKSKDEEDSEDEEGISSKKRKKNKKKAKDNVSIHSLLNNTLMQLRKIALSPLLIRTYYDDKKIKEMASVLKENDIDYMEEQLPYIIQDLQNLSDFELHSMCLHNSHVSPFKLEKEQLFETSGKLMKLKPILIKLIKEKHRILIFSQMTKVLDILELFLHQLNFEYVRLDGSTPVESRQVIIDNFNTNKEIPLFLLSTKAGGVGINLNTADTVIFFDLSFNYQVDRQAEDRCHRIGNEGKEVKVVKLIANGTVEEYIMKIVGGKKDLNDFMLDEGGFANSEERTKTSTTSTSVANLHSKYISKLFNQIFKEEQSGNKEESEEEEEEEAVSEEEEEESEEEEEVKPKRRTRKAASRKKKKVEEEEEEEEIYDDDEDY